MRGHPLLTSLQIAFAIFLLMPSAFGTEYGVPSKSAVISSVLKAPKSIPAGETGNVLLTLENPTKDTLNLLLFPEVPVDWMVLNSTQQIQLLPQSTKTVIYLLVPGQFAKVGLQKIVFNFIDIQKSHFIEQEVAIQVNVKHLLSIEQLDRHKAIAKESDGLTLEYEIINKGNVTESVEISSWEHEKEVRQTIEPGQSIHFYYVAKVPKNRTSLRLETGIRAVIFTKNGETKIAERVFENHLRILEYGAYQEKSKFSKYPLTLSSEYSILQRNVLEQRFSQKIIGHFPGLNEHSNLFVTGNYRNLQLGTRTINVGGASVGYKSKALEGIRSWEVGSISQPGDFYFRLRNNYIGSKIVVTKGAMNYSFGAHKLIPINPIIDTVRTTAYMIAEKMKGKYRYSAQSLAFQTRSGLGAISKLGGTYENQTWKLRNQIIHFQLPNKTYSLDAFATENDLTYNKNKLYGQLYFYASGKEFSKNGRDLISTQQHLRKQIGNLSVTVFNSYQENGWRQEISTLSSRSSSLNTQFTVLDHFNFQIKGRNSNMTARSIGKVVENTTNTLSASSAYRLPNLTITGGWSYLEQSFGSNTNAWNSNSFSLKTEFAPTKNLKLGLNAEEQLMPLSRRRSLGSQLSTQLGKNFTGRLRYNWLYQPDMFISNQHTAQAQIRLRGRRNSASFGVSFLADDNGRRQMGMSIGASAQLSTFNSDTTVYKKLEVTLLNPEGKPQPNVVVSIDGVKYITNSKGVVFAYNLKGNNHTYIIDKATLPYGFLPFGGCTYEEYILTTKKVERVVSLFKSSSIIGSIETKTSGMLQAAMPNFNQYMALIETKDGLLRARLDQNGNFRFDGLAPGTYNVRIKDLNEIEDGWTLEIPNQTLEINETLHKVVFQINENRQNIEVQESAPLIKSLR